jgi:hypothetical protein
MNVLIAYYPFGQIPKVVNKLDELFKKKGISCFLLETLPEQDWDLKKQFKKEKELSLSKKPSLKNIDLLLIGTPILSFTSAPTINVFIRCLPDMKKKKVILFATGIGLPGKAVKKMSSLLSMKNANVIDTQVFSSIFEFDSRKLLEVEGFFERFLKEIKIKK